MTGILDHLEAVLAAVVSGAEVPPPPADDAPAGAFVAIAEGGALRGFMGSVAPRGSFIATARELVRRAATEDGRFPALGGAGPLTLTVWRVGPARPIAGPGELSPGRDGVMIASGFHRAVHLPDGPDATDPEAFLESACIAAGLHPDAFSRPDVEVTAFEVTRLRRSDAGAPGGH